MIRTLYLSRSVTSISVGVNYAEGDISAVISRCGISSIPPIELPPPEIANNTAIFELPDDVHLLPIGFYDLIVKSGNCICSKIRVSIPRCDMAIPNTCVSSTPRDLPARDCQPECQCELPKQDECAPCGGVNMGTIPSIDIPLELWVVTYKSPSGSVTL